ncbi:hypothetical protein DQP55_12360 [Mycolicibacterium sp. GF69]|uniref:hypothetical protein n=1 Tax=Mycolicibacterium sp. GF69 TaxID=2267251 RepID=UPI000DCF6048|nr:hypothetical protein [Mycolicibacterium sp. GF69]RAV12409.1 hypothetical protein DQP55_12360 [Mycolicibacterium sp. GF69]
MSRFLISNLREGPDELRRQLPISGETVEIRIGPDGLTYFSARLDEQIMHRLDPNADTASLPAEHLGADSSGPYLWVSDIVMRPSRPGDAPHYGMQHFPVDMAYVLDLSYLDDHSVDFAKLQPIAAIDIDDLAEDAEPTHQAGQITVPTPTASADLDEDESGGAEAASGGAEAASGDLLDDAAPPAPADNHDIDGDNSESRDDLDHVPDDSPTSAAIAIPSDPAPAFPVAAEEPEPPAPPDPTPVPTAPNGAGHTHVPPEALPDFARSTAGTLPTARPPAATHRASEVTGPVRTATTARPPATPAAGARTPDSPPRRAHSAAPPTTSGPFGATPTGPPTRLPHHGSPPVHTSPWPEDARSPRPTPAPPTPPYNGALPPPIIPTTPGRRAPSTKALAIGAVVLVGLTLVGIAVWNVAGSSDTDPAAAPTTAQAKPTEEDLQRLNNALPKGYSEDSCTTDEAATDASVNCGPNTDAGGPTTATYTLYADQQALTQAFTDTIATYDRVTCPGNIQSPGPWRRNAAPDTVAGTLFCGTQAGQAVVVWTSDAQSLLNVAEAGAQGPSLDQLYAWWGTHS